MLKLTRVLSVVNPLVLTVLVGACGRAAMMEEHVVGGAAGVAFVVALVPAASAVMWTSKGAHMMARIARHDGDSVPRVSRRACCSLSCWLLFLAAV